jgi:hypothetical protein
MNIPSAGALEQVVTLPVNKDRVVSVTFPPFTSISEDATRLMTASSSVLSFPGKAGVRGSQVYLFDQLQ